MAADSDEPAAIAARRKALNLVSSNRWCVGAPHLPFPGLGHLRRDARRYAWLPVPMHRFSDRCTESNRAVAGLLRQHDGHDEVFTRVL